MADLPQGAGLIPNPVNRVAGFCQPSPLPAGFPGMAWPMMAWVLENHYAHLFHQQPIIESAILVMDAGEESAD